MIKFSWLFDKKTDLAFFFLPVFAGIIAYGLVFEKSVADSALLTFLILQGLGLGPFHLGASWAHLEDREIRSHLIGVGTRRATVLLTVAAILLLAPVAMLFSPTVVMAVYMATTIHHIVQQNAGILTLYHNYGAEAVPDKSLEIGSIHTAAWFCSLVYLAKVSNPAGWQQYALVACSCVVLVLLLASVIRCLADIRNKARSGLPVNGAALMFWSLSILFLFPFAFLGRNFGEALLIPLVMHWFQYVALNWILLRRKEVAADALSHGRSRVVLHFIAASAGMTLIVLTTGAIVSLAAKTGATSTLLSGFIVSLTLVHYLQDAFIWRFREPVLKQRLMRFLKPDAACQASVRRENMVYAEETVAV